MPIKYGSLVPKNVYTLNIFLKIVIPRPLLFIFGLFKQTMQILQQINVKNVHLVSGARIRTHNLLIMSLHF